MEENFYKDEFEKFLQEQANNHKMFPSDKVWGNIDNKLHGEKNWPALTVAAIAFLAAIIAVSVHFSPKPNIFAYKKEPVTKPGNNNSATSSTPLLSSVTNNATVRKQISWHYDKEQISKSGDSQKSLAEIIVKEKLPVAAFQSDKRKMVKNAADYRVTPKPKEAIDAFEENLETETANEEDKDILKATLPAAKAVSNEPIAKSEQPIRTKEDQKAMVDEYIKQHPEDLPALTQNKKKALKNTFSYLVYITPSASFRRLKEDADFLNQKFANTAGPVDLNYVADVNKIVRHVPGTGIEAGVSFRYNITDKLKVTSGLQFNIRQYTIEAFRSRTEVATIALQTSTGVDSVTKYSAYRTTNGYAAAELLNRYYQLSMPFGFEYEVVGSRKIALNIAANVQPTYTMNRKGYLISTNFKNYAESAGMLRPWNVNSNIEAFVNFKSGDFKWQIGPQFRYQHLPTFIKEYPIKEHLMDYGFKIGVSKTIQ